MISYPFSRRRFLAMGGAALAAPFAFPQSASDKPVRIAFIGVGSRGTHLLELMLAIPGVTIPAICDTNEDHLNRAVRLVKNAHASLPASFSKNPHDYKRMLDRDDFDAVLLATPAEWHAEMAVDAMNAGKHVASEVPGAHTVDECWSLVKTCKTRKRHYMLLENSLYDRTRMLVMNMTHAGIFGKPYYSECSYFHDCTDLGLNPAGSLPELAHAKRTRFRNFSPSHALGPVSKWMGINRDDRPVSLVSMMSKPASSHDYSIEKLGKHSAGADIQRQGRNINVTLIKTAKDRLITIFYDTDGLRPLSNFYLVQGTKGVYDSRHGVYVRGKNPGHQWENDLAAYEKEYGQASGNIDSDLAADSRHRSADFFLIQEFIQALREDRTPFVDVYDSATWSAVVELSAESIRKGGATVPFPNFT